MHLMTLSTDAAVIALVLLAISYAVSAYFRSDDTYNMMVIPACRYLNIPFVVPMEAGLMRSIHELPTIICGSVLSYYLKTVVENASSFLDPNTDLSAAELLQGQILNNSMFYIYLVAMTAMFLVVYTVRTKGIEHAWLVGVLSGVVVEFVLMLAGILFTGEKESIPLLVIGNVVTLIVGVSSLTSRHTASSEDSPACAAPPDTSHQPGAHAFVITRFVIRYVPSGLATTPSTVRWYSPSFKQIGRASCR